MRTCLQICCTLVFLSVSSRSVSQLCQGSLGDPVVNITFGAGNNPGPALGSTNYTYVTGDCPNDGFYTVENATSNCFGSTWYNVPEDHTPGDVHGYMMVVNASYNPGIFFQTNVTGLCPNTTYQFAAWIFNLLRPNACGGQGIKPNLTFRIESTDGTLLNSYQTGDIASTGQWIQYGLFFTTQPGESTVVLKMVNNAPGGCGNDLLVDDITFRACGPLVFASVAGNGDSVNVCTGDLSPFTMNASVSAGYNDPVFQWQQSIDSGATWQDIPGAADSSWIRPATTMPGTYLYRLQVSERDNMSISSCSILSNVLAVHVNRYPVPNASARGSCLGDSLFLSAGDGATYLWTGPSGFTSNQPDPFFPVATPADTGLFYVRVTSAKGCTTADTVQVSLYQKPVVDAGQDQAFCQGGHVTLRAMGSNNITSYQWTPASSLSDAFVAQPVAAPDTTTEYRLVAANHDCAVSDSVRVTVNQNPTADAGPDRVIIRGQSTTLQGKAAGTGISWEWNPDVFINSVADLQPVVHPAASQEYTLRVTSGVGCGIATDSVLVKVYQQLYIPNAFSPNGDGINDTWYIETLRAYPGADVKVYSREGQVLFDNHGREIWWDGTFRGNPPVAGAYVYVIDLGNNLPLIKGVVYIVL